LTEKQKQLLNFQKLKVLDSGTSSDSDEKCCEPNVALKTPQAKLHNKQRFADATNKMLDSYVNRQIVNEIDARLLLGVVSSTPVQDVDKPKKKEAVNDSVAVLMPVNMQRQQTS